MERLRSRWLGVVLETLAAARGACSSAELKQLNLKPIQTPPEGDPGADEDGGVPQPDGGGRREQKAHGGSISTTRGVPIQVQPSDNSAALINAIRSAKTSVHMTMYLLTSDDAIDALGDQKAAGVDVKVVLNQK